MTVRVIFASETVPPAVRRTVTVMIFMALVTLAYVGFGNWCYAPVAVLTFGFYDLIKGRQTVRRVGAIPITPFRSRGLHPRASY